MTTAVHASFIANLCAVDPSILPPPTFSQSKRRHRSTRTKHLSFSTQTQTQRQPRYTITKSSPQSPSQDRKVSNTLDLSTWTLNKQLRFKFLVCSTTSSLKPISTCRAIAKQLRPDTDDTSSVELYYHGCFPCRFAQICGMVVGREIRERFVTYYVDDGTSVLECYHMSPDEAQTYQKLGSIVRASGRIQINWQSKKQETREYDLVVDEIDRVDVNEESKHLLKAHELYNNVYTDPQKVEQILEESYSKLQLNRNSSSTSVGNPNESTATVWRGLANPSKIERSQLKPELLRTYMLGYLHQMLPVPQSTREIYENKILVTLAKRIVSHNPTFSFSSSSSSRKTFTAQADLPRSAQAPTGLIKSRTRYANEKTVARLLQKTLFSMIVDGTIVPVPDYRPPVPPVDEQKEEMGEEIVDLCANNIEEFRTLDDQIQELWGNGRTRHKNGKDQKKDSSPISLSASTTEEYYTLPTVDNLGLVILSMLPHDSYGYNVSKITDLVKNSGGGEWQQIPENTIQEVLEVLRSHEQVECIRVGFWKLV